MRLIKFLAGILFICFVQTAQAQDPNATPVAVDTTAIAPVDTVIPYWNKKGFALSGNFANSSYSHWVAGGSNSINMTGMFTGFIMHDAAKFSWSNYLLFSMGAVRQSKMPTFRKTDDRIVIISKWSYKETQTVRYTGMVDFRTQSLNGYNYPTLESDSGRTLTSAWFAPAYLQASLGLELKARKRFYAIYSPIASKYTFVLNDTLSAQQLFGLEHPGDRIRAEFFGTSINARVTLDDIVKNVGFVSNINLFSNYVYDFKHHLAIDVNWDNVLTFKVNRFISANWTWSMIYDEDVKQLSNPDDALSHKVPYVQWKNVIGIGVTVKLGQEYKDL